MQKNVNKYIRVSEIIAWAICPRKAFFRINDKNGKHGVRKEMILALSSTLPDVIRTDEPLPSFYASLDRISDDALLIYGPSSYETIDKVKRDIQARANDIIEGVKKTPYFPSMKIAAERMTIYSDRLSLSGAIDRVYEIKGALAPAYVSGSAPPPAGAYATDRLRIAAYAMLVEERYGIEADTGYIEYFPGWQMREVVIRNTDRWAALSSRNRVAAMKEGRMPDAKRGNHCGACEFRDRCNVRVSFLDRLMG